MSAQGPNGADPARPAGPDETIVLRDAFIAQGRAAPLENGWAWIASAWPIFSRAAFMWIGMMLVLLIIHVAFAFLHVFGFIASILGTPVFAAGLMMASRTIDQGGEPRFSQLFGGFKHRFGQLLGVGVLYLVGTGFILLIVFLIAGASVLALIHATTPEEIMALGATVLLGALIFLALLLPLLMAIWFAPALVVFHDLRPVEAMKASFTGCMRNVLPFLLYGVVLFLASIVASIPVGLGWLVLGPVTAASIYTSYRDIYFSA